MNLPVAAGSGAAEFLALVQHVVAPIARDFAPDLIIVSAGYDAHSDDPLAELRARRQPTTVSMAASVRDLGGELDAPVLVCLEGGYAINALASSVLATVEALDDDKPAGAVDLAPAEPARDYFRQGRWREALSR